MPKTATRVEDGIAVVCSSCSQPAVISAPAEDSLEERYDAETGTVAVGVTWKCNCAAGVSDLPDGFSSNTRDAGSNCSAVNWHEVSQRADTNRPARDRVAMLETQLRAAKKEAGL